VLRRRPSPQQPYATHPPRRQSAETPSPSIRCSRLFAARDRSPHSRSRPCPAHAVLARPPHAPAPAGLARSRTDGRLQKWPNCGCYGFVNPASARVSSVAELLVRCCSKCVSPDEATLTLDASMSFCWHNAIKATVYAVAFSRGVNSSSMQPRRIEIVGNIWHQLNVDIAGLRPSLLNLTLTREYPRSISPAKDAGL